MKSQLILTWNQIEEFPTIKHLKDQLEENSKREKLSPATWRAYKYWLKKLLKFTDKTPDQLIEEALQDPEETKKLLRKFKNHCIESGINENVAINGTHGPIRGFFRHNGVYTFNWKTPTKTTRMIGQIDDNYPLFIREGKKLVLNRELLTEFQSKLNYRDQLILDCLISTGLDDGDLLKLNVDFVLSQNQPRLYLNNNRQKTMEDIHVFFSKIASKKLREYVRKERTNAEPNDPLFITTLAERKRVFLKIHGRKYTNLDELPEGNRLSNVTLAINFRKASRHTGISLVKQQQSPLRPKRLRKVFESACTHAGIDPDIKDIFMGHKGSQSKTYQGKSREELEFYYDMVEPKITIQIHETDESTELREKIKELQSTGDDRLKALEKKLVSFEVKKKEDDRLDRERVELDKKDPITAKKITDLINLQLEKIIAKERKVSRTL